MCIKQKFSVIAHLIYTVVLVLKRTVLKNINIQNLPITIDILP